MVCLAPAAARVATRLSLGAIGLALAGAVGFPQLLRQSDWLPFAVGLLVGLPHGAVDHLVPQRLVRAPPCSRTRVLLLAGYVTTAVAFFVAFRLWPTPSALLFVAVSVAHFGAGDAAFADARNGRAPRLTVVRVLGFGAPPVVLPLVCWPEQVRPVVAAFAPGLGVVVDRPVSLVLGAVTVLAAAAVVVGALRERDRLVAVEVALLVAAGFVVPPLLAFGVYFGAWHALRHVARLVSLDPGAQADLEAGCLTRPLVRFAGQAALPTALSLFVLGLLWSGAGGPSWSEPGAAWGLIEAHLGLLAALTIPHVGVVALLDRVSARDYQPRDSQLSSESRSAPSVVSSPCPGYTQVSSG